MDPKALSNLDPKLRETYERVMGTTTPSGSPTAPPPVTSAPNETSPAPKSSPLMETPFANEQSPGAVTISQPLPASAPMTPLASKHKHSGLIKVLYILGAIVFFTIYLLFWAKIFNFKLPFLG